MVVAPSAFFRMVTRLSDIVKNVEELGIRIEVGDDFAEYRARRLQQVGRGPIYPMFDAASSYVDHTNGFWICGFNDAGDLIHTQAVRALDLSGISLVDHLRVHRHKYITPDSSPDPDRTMFFGPTGLSEVTGRVCYHGEFWLQAQGLGGPRSQGATALLSRLLLEIAVEVWSPSYVFAFVPKRLAAKGAHLRYGYPRCEPGQWIGPDKQVTDEDYLIWMDETDLANLLDREVLQPRVHTTAPSGVISSDASDGPVVLVSSSDGSPAK
ncbi:MAG: hypothetical protein AAF376_04715 [Pseudomonadota bacterium]